HFDPCLDHVLHLLELTFVVSVGVGGDHLRPQLLSPHQKEFRSVCQRSPFIASMEKPIFGLFPSCARKSCPLRTIMKMPHRTVSLLPAFVKVSSSLFEPAIT